MSIEFRCVKCRKLLRTPDDAAGRKAICPQCETILSVPAATAQEPHPEADSSSPFDPASPPAEPSTPPGSPFAAAGPPQPEPGDPDNPYRAPADYGTAPMLGAVLPASTLAPTRIDIGQMFSRTWTIFKDQWPMCLLVVIVAIVLTYVGGIILLYVPAIVGAALGNPVLMALCFVVGYIASILFQFWIGVGTVRFLLRIARGQEADFAELFRGGPHMLPIVITWILCTLAMGGVSLVPMLPGILVAVLLPDIALPILIICGVIAYVVAIVVMLMLVISYFLVIDRNLDPIEALRVSLQVTRGNKLKMFVLSVIAYVLTVISILPCGVGLLVTAPYFALMTVVVYLSMTGQATAAHRAGVR